MTSKTDIVKSKIMKVYEVDEFQQLLKGIQVAACMITESHQVVDEASVLRRLSALTLNGPSDGNCCSCCGVGPFETRAQQTAHYKHHWHTHNLKRKLFGKESLTLGQFTSRRDGNSSVSGSDSEGDESATRPASDLFAAATRHCKAFFTNKRGQVFCIYRCILHHKKEELSTDGDGSAWVERCQRISIPFFQRWAVLMVSGGHFAGAVFSGSVPVVHKTFHSYVTRRGQGQAQGTRDRHGHAPRSAGASLRRYNQAKFLEHVQEIVVGWTKELTECSLVLYRAVGPTNQAAIFGKNSPITRDDVRVRLLPFPTRKPTYKEVKRVHETVASIEVYETMELFQKALIASTAKTSTKTSSDTSIEKTKKTQKSFNKPIDRAKSRERAPRELPTQIMSSEDEGPSYIDSETPANWIKTLSEQSSKGVITNSRKDLLNDTSIAGSECSGSDRENKPEKRKKKKKGDEKKVEKKGDEKTADKTGDEKKIEKKIDELNVEQTGDEKKGEKADKPKVEQTGDEKKGEKANKPKVEQTGDEKKGEKADKPKVEQTGDEKKGEKADKPKVEQTGDEKKVEKTGNEKGTKKTVSKIPLNVKKMWKAISGGELNKLETIFEKWEGDIELAFNTQDPADGNTALHKAAIAAKPEIVTQILSAGGDPCVRNHLLQTPYAASPHPDTRIAFRMFQASYPDKYNYAKAHIPGPLTPEQLELEKEKKTQQKRAKRQRDKEKQQEKLRTSKFLLLTDAQKVKSAEKRCCLCGVHLPKKPYEYNLFRFCSVRCLQNHRNIRPLHMSA